MAKKTGKPVKDKKKPVKKAAAKAAPKKAAAKPAAKLAKKPAPAKKAAAAKVAPTAKKAAAKAPAKAAAAKAPAKGKAEASGKGLLKAVGKAIATVAKKAIEKVPAAEKAEKPAKAAKAPKPAPEAKVKAKAPAPVEEIEIEAPGDEELVDEEIVLTDAEGRRYCRVKDCDQLSAVDGYCRYHYLALWKKIQVRKKILSEGKLERYIEELTARYPDKFLEMLRKDLRSEKEFLAAIQELEIDENADNSEFEDEAQNYIDEVRGMEPTARDDEDF